MVDKDNVATFFESVIVTFGSIIYFFAEPKLQYLLKQFLKPLNLSFNLKAIS